MGSEQVGQDHQALESVCFFAVFILFFLGYAKSCSYTPMYTLLTLGHKNMARIVNSKSEIFKVQVWASGGHIYLKAPFRAPWSYTVFIVTVKHLLPFMFIPLQVHIAIKTSDSMLQLTFRKLSLEF